MQQRHQISISDTLYSQLKILAKIKGQTVESLVNESLEETIEEGSSNDMPLLLSLPDPNRLLPTYGSKDETQLRLHLASLFSKSPALSQIVIDDRGEH